MSGNRASVGIKEASEAQFEEGIMEHSGMYTYELIKIGEKWKIFRITKELCPKPSAPCVPMR